MINVLALIIVCFLLVMLLDCVRHRKEIRPYLEFGFVTGAVVIAMNALISPYGWDLYLSLGGLWKYHELAGDFRGISNAVWGTLWAVIYTPLTLGLIEDFLRAGFFTCLGMFYCSQIGGLDLPLARLLLGKSPSTQRNLSRRYVLSVAAVTVSGIAYSLLVYKVFDLRNILRTYTGTSSAGSFGTIFFWLLLNASISEELLFRLCIQNFLASKFRLMRNRYWIAVVLTAGLWSLFHMGVPFLAWAKFLQVFPFGVALGFLFRKYGLEACILTHAGFNVGLNTIALYFSLFR